jgi:hypothetical protein
MRLLGFLIALLASLAAASQPTHVESEYVVTASGGITIGRAKATFTRNGDTYSIKSEMRSDGALKVFLDDQFTTESSGRVDKDGLKPLEYSERRAKDNKRDFKSTFNWKNNVVHTVVHDDPSDAWFPPGTQDPLSLYYQFMHMKELGETVAIPMADRRRIDAYTYKLVGEDRIVTPAGEFDTRHYRRIPPEQPVPTDRKETKVDLWLAKDRYNFLVRVTIGDPRGYTLEQSLVALDAK